jgi:uncharacterized protein YukE
MAKNALEIQMNYQAAIRQADSLKSVARELKKLAENDLGDCISELSYNWTGSNETAYTRKCSQLKSNLITMAEKLDRTSSTIRSIAKNTYHAEMKALALAQARSYK